MITELRPDHKLLDPKFSGYKLSLDSIPVYHQNIDEGVDHISQSEDQYSFTHAKVFSLHNHLFCDPYHDKTVFFVNKCWEVMSASVNSCTNRLSDLEVVWTIPNLNQREPGHFNCSFGFPCQQTAIISDGCSRLHLLNRPDSGQWQLALTAEVEPSVVMSARLDSESHLHCVLMSLETVRTDEVNATTFNKPKPAPVNTVLLWSMFVQEGSAWKEQWRRRLEGPGSMEYVTLEASCQALYVTCIAKPKICTDSDNHQVDMEIVDPENKAKYTWIQTVNDIKIVIQVKTEVTKRDVEVNISERTICISCKEEALVTGPLSHPVDSNLTTWTLDSQRLEVTLVKKDSGQLWSEVIPGDKGGEQLFDSVLTQGVHSRLSHLCTDTEVQEVGESYGPTFNLDQLEECDSAPEDSLSLYRIDAISQSISHQILLTGHQWLMAISLDPTCICFRHDVDGCIWRLGVPDSSPTWPCQHISTFYALGYIAASKQHKKFVLAPPDLSYTVICEASNHIFVYHKPSLINGEIRNRTTSSRVMTVAKQQLINLRSSSPILGACALNSYLFVLTSDSLHLYHMQ